MSQGGAVRFKTGNICRIYIKDFLTFDEVEVRPKPRLNFICGPNGSGKSTILCAICICLGGRPSFTGRGKEVYEFVKSGKEEAIIEIEVFVEEQINVVVLMTINAARRKTSWSLQGNDVSKREVYKKIEELNIQVDNLCQFLPQDRVASFARLNNQELLQATEKAVGDPSLFQNHMTLCTSGEELVNLQDSLKELTSQLDQEVKRNARLKDVVENLEVKVKLEKDIKQLHTQRLWCLYDVKRQIFNQHSKELKKKKQELEQRKKELEPLTGNLQQKKALLHHLKKMVKEKSDWMYKNRSISNKFQEECEKHRSGLREAKLGFHELKQMEEQRQNEIMDYNRQLDVLLGQLNNLPEVKEPETGQRQQALTEKIHNASQTIVRLQGKLSENTMEREARNRAIASIQKELEAKQDVTNQRLELLRDRNKDAYQATHWLRSNSDIFHAAVHPPMCILLNIKNPSYAKHVENRVMMRDLVSFVCEDKDDVNTLKEEMDRQRLRVNIVHSYPTEISTFKPQYSMDELRKYGFDHYMLDCLDAPPAILTFLCRSYSIHTVPIAESGDYGVVPASLSIFYMGNNRYSRSRSRYDGEISTSIYPLRNPQLLHIVLDINRIKELNEKVDKLKVEIGEREKMIQAVRREESELSKNLETWRNEKRALASRKEERNLLEQRISYKRSQINRRKQDTINLDTEKAKLNVKVLECVQAMVGATVHQKECMKGSVDQVTECIKGSSKAQVVVAEVKDLEKSMEAEQKELETLEYRNKEIENEVEKERIEGQEALRTLMNLLGITSVREITKEIRMQFLNCTLEDTERNLAEKEAHHDCLVTATSTELREFRNRQKDVEKLNKRRDELERKLENHHQDLAETKERWLPHIKTLVGSISLTFSRFMSRMGCAGEVVLKTEGENFNSYGMAIRVKFRDQQKLQELTAQHQSGGERAVSTALYLLALQSLTKAPFRCVDEINQGMDLMNEKQMLKMLMETEAHDESSQYFFVTPKLIQDMEYTKNVNVMVVLNSPTALSHRRITIKRSLKRKKEIDKKR